VTPLNKSLDVIMLDLIGWVGEAETTSEGQGEGEGEDEGEGQRKDNHCTGPRLICIVGY